MAEVDVAEHGQAIEAILAGDDLLQQGRPGAQVLHEPRLWPEYHASYYRAFVCDPDGNNIEAVCHAPE